MTNLEDHWNERYEVGNTPWDSGLPSRELRRVLDEEQIEPCRAMELGCGTGTNSVFLASRGFEVTAVDCSALALEAACALGKREDVSVEWICADVCELPIPDEPFPFVFDRGCYHCCRRDNRSILKTLERITEPGSRFLVLTGNADEPREHGPPQLTEQQIRDDLGELFAVDFIRSFYFEDPGGVKGPLGWSCLLTRR